MEGKTFDGEDGLHTPTHPSSSEGISDDLFFKPKHKIFLSHCGAQKEFVEHLCKALEEICHYPFFNKCLESVPMGTKFLDLILKAAQQCQLFVVVVSEEYFMSKWPMIALNAFVKSKKELKSTFDRGLLPLFYGLSVSELEDERRRLRWLEKWEIFAKDDLEGLIKVDDWKYALDVLTMFNGFSYDRELKEIVKYEDEIVFHISRLVTPDIKWNDLHVKGNAHEVIKKGKHRATAISSHSLLREVVQSKTFDGEDGLHTPTHPSSSEGISDDLFFEPKHEIFLSHCGAQKGFAEHLCKALEESCHYPFFDRRPESLPKDINMFDLIVKAVQQCQLFVVVVSEEYFMSKWPMIELNAFVKAREEMKSNMNLAILPLFYGLSVNDLKDERRRLRWLEKWEIFAKDNPRGLIKVEDWNHALDELTKFNGLSYDRELKEIVKYENDIVFHISKLVTPTIKWKEGIGDDPIFEPKHKIFLSHSGAQKEFVEHLCKALEESCHYPFFDRRPESVPKGTQFLHLILKAAQQCQLFVVVVSEEYFMSKWPMIELNAFVKAREEMKSNMNLAILPLFYGLSVNDLKDERRRLRWLEKWEIFAKDNPRGLIKVEDWNHALDELTKFNGLSYDRELKEIVKYENDIVFHISKLVTPTIKWKEGIGDDPIFEPKHKIFLSHSGAQKEFVEHLCKALEESCHYPFFDRRPESVPKGTQFLHLILKAAQQCQLFVVVVSEEYFMSKWPMIELNAFVKAREEMKSNMNLAILPLFYGLSVNDLKDERRRLRWLEKWEIFAKDNPRGLIKVEDWNHALDELTKFNGLSYDRELKEIVKYENDIVFHISKLVTPNMSSLLRDVVTEFIRLRITSPLTYPAGDPDPVRIKDEDLQSLQPKRHLSINIIDFYIKYLEKEVLSFKDRDRFFFFNCSFFISTSTDINSEQARLWTRGVNLFEKDYIFIPVHKSELWSLIIIYHLSSLTGSPIDVHYRSPGIFHLYSVEGKHDDLEGDIRSFIFKSWTEIHQNSDILQALFRMKYVEAKIPHEDNGYDSGIYLLHYMELFILESTSPDFRFGTEQGKSHFPGWGTSEVVAKRKHIQNLISKLSRMTQLQGTLRLHSSDIFSWLQFKAASEGRIKDAQNSDLTMVNGKGAESEHGGHQTGGVTVLNNHQPFDVSESLRFLREDTRLRQENEASRLTEIEEIIRPHQAEESLLQADIRSPKLRNRIDNRKSRKSNWSVVETSVLLRCIVNSDRFRQGNNAGRWDAIAGEVSRACGTTHTSDQCRYRFDTLLKAYKQVDQFCRSNAKVFSEMTENERRGIKLATTLTGEWYTLIAQHYTYGDNHRKFGEHPFDCPSLGAAEIQIEALDDGPSNPRIDTDKLLFGSASEFQSEILREPPPARPNNRHDRTTVPESLLTTDPRPLVQRRKSSSDEDEMKGVYRRAVKDSKGNSLRFRYEPRFKPPRDIYSLGEPGTYKMLSLGSYSTPQDAKDVRQIAAYYYGRGDARLDLGHGTHFVIPDCDSGELQSMSGAERRKWVQCQAKKVFAAFQMQKAGLEAYSVQSSN